MKTKLEGYEFRDQHGHHLERCQDYLDIVDVIEKAKEFIEKIDENQPCGTPFRDYETIRMEGRLKQALAKVIKEKIEIKDKYTLNYQLEQMGFTGTERIVILDTIDSIWKHRKEFKE